MKNKNFVAFAITLLVMFGIAFASSAFVPVALANETSQSVTKSVKTDSSFTTVADFSLSDETRFSAPVNSISQSDSQKIRLDNTKPNKFQFNYPNFAETATSPPKYNFERLYDNAQINGYKFEITPNWRTCKSDTYFFNDYKPEFVWHE